MPLIMALVHTCINGYPWIILMGNCLILLLNILKDISTSADSLSRMMNFSSESPLATDDLDSDEVPMVEHQLCLTRATNS